ncbi:nuclear receptor [Oryctes borbonicus]|uniref:Nuclear receptor n=1 Tax=Oryctes borbonicus TaxID=1629725 RepID=A0A0T6BHN1_9SCAR|nr:nuclear receptor [Oryctes borbonicus]
MGMKREAVQEERQRTKERDTSEVESTSSMQTDMPIERILEAEKRGECKDEQPENPLTNFSQATNKQLLQLVDWAKCIPHFTSLPIKDQVLLLRAGWNELLIAAFSHRSIEATNGIVLATGLTVYRDSAANFGVGAIFDRVLTELVAKMREMKMDKTELGCLRTIILFNPDVRGLRSVHEVEMLREKVYGVLEEYTRSQHPNEPGRFAKLLLRLPALRSIGLKCLEHLFFSPRLMINNTPIETFLTGMLESPSDS